MKIFPAIDLLDQKVVRLYQGDYEQKEVFGDDPVAFARSFEEEGANYLHLVDLDGAKAGKLHYFDVAKKSSSKPICLSKLAAGFVRKKRSSIVWQQAFTG